MDEQTKGIEFFEQVRREHDELRELLGAMTRALADRRESAEKVSEMVAMLCEHVETHFQSEEGGEFFDEIVDHAPRLSERANAVCREHAGLLDQVRRVGELAAQKAGTDDWWSRLSDEFHGFSRQLMQHESREVELMQEAYAEDIGSKD